MANNSRIVVSLKESSGREIIDSNDLTANIQNGNLSIDGEKLYGIDSFVINAKRLKCTVNLPYNDAAFSDTIKGLFTDETKIVKDEMPTTTTRCLRISEQDVIDVYSLESIWGTDYSIDPDNHSDIYSTWHPDNVDSGTFYLRSIKLQNIISASAWNFFNRQYNNGNNNRLEYSQTSNKRGYLVNNIKFDIAFLTVIEFFSKYLVEWYKENVDENYVHSYTNQPAGISGMTTCFKAYLNSIITGFGDEISDIMDNYRFSTGSGVTVPFKLGHLFYQNAITLPQGNAVSFFSPPSDMIIPNNLYWGNDYPQATSIQLSWLLFDYAILNSSSVGSIVFHLYTQEYGDVAMGLYTNFSNNQSFRIAGFINSMLQYRWFNDVIEKYVGSFFKQQTLDDTNISFTKYTNIVMLNNSMEIIHGVLPNRGEPIPLSNSITFPHNGNDVTIIYNNISYNFFFDNIVKYGATTTITTLRPYIGQVNENLQNDYTPNNVYGKIGKPKTKTMTTDVDGQAMSDSGMEVTFYNPDTDFFSSDELYIPVYRDYRFMNSDFYKFNGQLSGVDSSGYESMSHAINNPKLVLLDNFDYNKIAHTQNYQTMLIASGYTDNNWMYFDNIFIHESLYWMFNPQKNDDIVESVNGQQVKYHYRDEVPVFDKNNGDELDNYGLYVYRDYFNNYYTKQDSSLMHIYIDVGIIDSNGAYSNIYRGIVDYNSVNITNNSLSFEATDAIGVLFENIKKLNGYVWFSQYDIANGASDIAIVKSGTVIRKFIEGLIRYPLPYRTSLANPNFAFDDSLENSTVYTLDNKVMKDITVEDAFIIAMQASKSILYVDNNGLIQIKQIESTSAITGLEEAEMDGYITSFSSQNSNEIEEFSISKIENISGWQKFTPSIASFYNSLHRNFASRVNVEIAQQENPIKVLDKIWIDGICYLVIESSFDLRNSNSIGLR